MYEQLLFLFFVILFLAFILQPIPTIDFSQLRLAIKEFETTQAFLKAKEINSSEIEQIASNLNISYISISFRNNTFSFGNFSRSFGNFCFFLNHSLACIQIGIR
jgi:hypothetical protein